MQVSKLSLLIPALMLVSAAAFADQSAVPPQGQGYPQQPYPDQGYGYQDSCGGCGPGAFDPGSQYYCQPGLQCPVPQLPYGPLPQVYPAPLPPPVVVNPPIYTQPIYPPPVIGRPFYGRPGWGGIARPPVAIVPPMRGPIGYGRPYRHISAEGCAIHQDNSHRVSVVLPDDKETVIYTSTDEHAYENAVYMQKYYTESASGICGVVGKSDQPLDI